MIWLGSLFKLLDTIVKKAPLTTKEKREWYRYKIENKFKKFSKKAKEWLRHNHSDS